MGFDMLSSLPPPYLPQLIAIDICDEDMNGRWLSGRLWLRTVTTWCQNYANHYSARLIGGPDSGKGE